jgi:zinc protease
MLDERMFRGRAFGLDPLGSAETLAALGSDDLIAFHRAHYGVSGLVLAVVGDVEADKVFAAAEKLFPAGGAPAKPVPVPSVPPRERTLEVYLNAPIEQSHLVIGFPGAALGDSDRFALDVVAALLAGQGGRLFDSLRERRGLAYHVSAFSFESVEPGYLAIHVVCSPRQLPTVRAEIEAQIALLRDVPVDEAELARARRWLHGGHAQALERRADRASALAMGEAQGLGADASLRWNDQISAVTAADVQAAARAHLDWPRAVVAVVQPRDLTPAAALRAAGKKMKAPAPAKSRSGAKKAAPR